MEPLSSQDQALVARSINELPTKDDVRALLRLMADEGHEDMTEIPVHELPADLQRKLYDFVSNVSRGSRHDA